MTDVYALFGNQIQHSLSPILHKQFAEQFGIDIEYRLIDVPHGHLYKALQQFLAAGGAGANVTAPYKQHFLNYAQVPISIKAVNTLAVRDGNLFGYNTDGIGFLQDLKSKEISINDKKVLILGTGGAARTLENTLRENNVQVSIAGRNAYQALIGKSFDLVINATSAGLAGIAPNLPQEFSLEGAICYDLNYGDAAQPFLDLASSRGADKVISGIGMLIHQAAESFNIWHGVRPSTGQIYLESVL